MRPITILKVGGSVLEDEKSHELFLDACCKIEQPFILVHGGGKRASALSKELGVEPVMIDGRRVTDEKTLEIAVMTYSGWYNTSIVAHLGARGVQVLGVSGADLKMIESVKRPPREGVDFGYVGDIQQVRVSTLKALLDQGISPVFCAITCTSEGQLLNTNADAIAGHLATALAKEGASVRLQLLFEYSGVLRDINDPSSSFESLLRSEVVQLIEEGSVHSGMMAKLEEGFRAAEAGVEVRIGSYREIEKLLASEAGTRLTSTGNP
jgi:acetylglutamate kinase